LSATNLEMGITAWIGAKITDEGSTTVPARTFSDLVNTLPEGQVEMDLAVRTQTLNVRSGASITDIKCIDSQEFPPIPVPDLEGGIVFKVSELKELIRQTVFTASSDDARPVLTGVLVTVEDQKVTLAAADGFRLSIRSMALPESNGAVNAIVPARALNELARIAGDSNENITMVLPPGRGQVIFRMNDIELTSQLIEGNFPDFQQIIPASHNTRTVVSTASFLKACKQAEIFARDGSHIARINIVPGDEMQQGSIEISAQSEETGSSEAMVEATIDGQPVLIAFNVRYLREVLDVVGTQNVALETTAAAAPGVIRALGEDDFLHVIMPMHLGG
ncbi:MAG: DNA polymerase III subunit beta, partial [Chloroflexota bacterium]